MSKRDAPLSVRLSQELKDRLEETAARVHISKHTLAQEAIEAAVLAIEQNDYKIVMPIQFDVRDVPAPKRERDEFATAEDRKRDPTKYPLSGETVIGERPPDAPVPKKYTRPEGPSEKARRERITYKGDPNERQ